MSDSLSDWDKAKARAGLANPGEPDQSSSPEASRAEVPSTSGVPTWAQVRDSALESSARQASTRSFPDIPVREHEKDIFLADHQFVTPEHARRPAITSQTQESGPSALGASVGWQRTDSTLRSRKSEAQEDSEPQDQDFSPSDEEEEEELILGDTNPKIVAGFGDEYGETNPKIVAALGDVDAPLDGKNSPGLWHETGELDLKERYFQERLKTIEEGNFIQAMKMQSPRTAAHSPDITASFFRPFRGRVTTRQMIVRGLRTLFILTFGYFLTGLMLFAEPESLGWTILLWLHVGGFFLCLAYGFSLMVRRLHDSGYAGALAIPLAFIPLIGVVIALALPRQEFHNIYGNYKE